MGAVESIGNGPEIRVFIESGPALNLGDVARFLQRLDTGARRVASRAGAPSRVEIIDLATGSLNLKIKIAGLRAQQAGVLLSAATLAVGVAAYFKDDPAASKSCRALFIGPATVMTIEGGDAKEEILPQDVEPREDLHRHAYDDERLTLPSAAEQEGDFAAVEFLKGPQTGVVRRYGDENFVELDDRPWLFIHIRDERDDKREPLLDSARYIFDGEAHLSSRGRPSVFLLRVATPLS